MIGRVVRLVTGLMAAGLFQLAALVALAFATVWGEARKVVEEEEVVAAAE